MTDKTKDINQTAMSEAEEEKDALEEDYLTQNLEEPEGYEAEF